LTFDQIFITTKALIDPMADSNLDVIKILFETIPEIDYNGL
jgi:hypothetical protein